MTGTDQPTLSAFLMQARSRSASEALRLYCPYYEDLLRYNFSNRDFIEQRDAPGQVFCWLVELHYRRPNDGPRCRSLSFPRKEAVFCGRMLSPSWPRVIQITVDRASWRDRCGGLVVNRDASAASSATTINATIRRPLMGLPPAPVADSDW